MPAAADSEPRGGRIPPGAGRPHRGGRSRGRRGLEGHVGGERGAAARARLDRQRPVEQAEPLAHADEPERVVAHLAFREAAPVVLDQGADAAVAARQHDAHSGVAATLKVATAASHGVAHFVAEVAGEVDADVTVVGTRGHGPLAGAILGSVAQHLLHVAPCPLLAIPPLTVAELVETERETVEAAH
ncbi:MAG TPA: universal stress protein [Gaiellaceae bacterium]